MTRETHTTATYDNANVPKQRLRMGELFAGAGGFGLGFVLAHHPKVVYQPLFAVEKDETTLGSYRRNTAWLRSHAPDLLHDTPDFLDQDVADLDVHSVLARNTLVQGELDILIGGPPCQGFSSSNKSRNAQPKHDNNYMVNVFLDRVRDISPKMFVMENVQGVRWTQPTDAMRSPREQQQLLFEDDQGCETVQAFLEWKARQLGYEVWSNVEDAADFGVPQHRLRFFLFGVRRDLLNEQTGVSLTPYLQKYKTADPVSVAQAIDDLPPLDNGEEWNSTDYEPDLANPYIEKLRQYMDTSDLHDHFATLHSAMVVDRFRRIKPGQNWQSIREHMTTYTQIDNTHCNIYRRLRPDRCANTISHYRKSMVIHPSQDRGLSFREACRLQSCPDWFRFNGTRGQRQQQLANMVPPLMAAQVAYAIAEWWLDQRWKDDSVLPT